jgi:hypothetical protein
MSGEEPEILGSTITRVLVPRNLPTMLSVTTVSADILAQTGRSLKQLTSELTGAPMSQVISEAEYRKITSLLSSEEFWAKLEEKSNVDPWPTLAPSRSPGLKYFSYLKNNVFPRVKKSANETGSVGLTNDCIVSELSSDRRSGQTPFSPQPSWGFGVSETLAEFEVEPASFYVASTIWFDALAAGAAVQAVMPSLDRYEIPYGQSPKAKSDTLGTLLRSAKSSAVAPLLTSSAYATTAIQGAHYLTALKCEVAGAAATLIFIGTISVAELIIAKLSSLRGGN